MSEHDEQTSVGPGAGDRRADDLPEVLYENPEGGTSVADPEAEAERQRVWEDVERVGRDSTFDDVDTGAGKAHDVTDPRLPGDPSEWAGRERP